MPVVSGTIANLFNGVSQQAPSIRLNSQGEAQENGLSSPVDGLKKRPPLEFIAKLTGTTYSDALIHTINRDTTERYQVILVNGNLFVYDLAGNARTVAFPDGKGYLNTSTPSTTLKALTVVDYTFIVNTSVTVAMTNATTPVNSNTAFVFVKQALNGVDYKVTLNGTTYTYTTGATGAVSTSVIAAGLASAIGTGPDTTFTVTRTNYVLQITRSNSTNFTVSVEDSEAGGGLISFKDKTQHFSDLPRVCKNGYIMEIINDASSQFDNYYVVFQTNDGSSSGEGVWVETVQPGIQYQLDTSTMPYILVRESDGSFTFKRASWTGRVVGDAVSAPNPSFVGNTLNDVFFYKNRLGLLSQDNCIFSEAGEFFNFFNTTATTQLDSFPIDVSAAHTRASTLYHAVPYNEELLLFSDQTQFILSSDGLLTAKTVAITPTTQFESDKGCQPVGSGPNVYFSTKAVDYTGIREYFVDNVTATKDAAEVTAHVPKYLPTNVYKIAACPTQSMLVVLTKSETNAMYIYKYLWNNNEKVQSSWSKWTFSPDTSIMSADFIEDVLYVVTQRADGIFLEKIRVSPRTVDPNSTFVTLLDRRVSNATAGVSVSYNSSLDQTTWTLPYQVSGTMQVVNKVVSFNSYLLMDNGSYVLTDALGNIVVSSIDTPSCDLLNVVSSSGNTVTVKGNHQFDDVYIGQQYIFKYQFSTIFIKEQSASSGSSVPITGGRLQLKELLINCSKSSYFTVVVQAYGRDAAKYEFTGNILGSGVPPIGGVPILDGVFRTPVLSRNTQVTITIENDSPLPSNFISAEWIGYYTNQAQRI